MLKVKIGGIVLAIASDDSGHTFGDDVAYKAFVTDDQADVILRVHYGVAPAWEFKDRVFDSSGIWSLYRGQGKWGVCQQSPALGPDSYQVAIFEPNFQSGDIYVRANERDQSPYSFPLGWPLAEVLMINLLSRGRGVLLHAFGISDGVQGTIFAGSSGAGKSTLATLWEGQRGVTLLSDDRVIVRKREGRFWVYGTPWHGDARVASRDAVPLERIFLIQHASENRAVPLSPLEATSRLLVRSFPTFWNAVGMAFTLECLAQLSQAVPCYELGFVPDESVVEFVRCLT